MKFCRNLLFVPALGLCICPGWFVCAGFAQTDAGEPVIMLSQTGGYAGVSRQWRIYADGRVSDGDGKIMGVDATAVERLRSTIQDSGFFGFAGSYIPKKQCCDHFSYVITVRDGSRSHTVATIDQAAGAPAALTVILNHIKELLTAMNK